MCNRFPHWVALAQCPFGSAISFPKCLPAVVSPLVLASDGSVWVLACGSKHPSPLWGPMTNGGAGQAYGGWARNSLRVPREPPFHCLSGRSCGLVLNLSCVLAAAGIVLFIITFIWSNCFLKPSTSSMQITCVPDFLSKIKPTMTLLCKQSLSTSEHFNSFPLKTKP